MPFSKKELISYFVPLSDRDGTERSVRVKGCFNTYLIRRKGASSMHYYLRQRLVLGHSGKHISINHGCWEDNNLPTVSEFKQLMAFCNCCYFAAVNGLNPTELENLSVFAGVTNKNEHSANRIFHKNNLSSLNTNTSGQTNTAPDTNVNSQVAPLSSDEAVSVSINNPQPAASDSFSCKEESGIASDNVPHHPPASVAKASYADHSSPLNSNPAPSFYRSSTVVSHPDSGYPSCYNIGAFVKGALAGLTGIENSNEAANSIKLAENDSDKHGSHFTLLTTANIYYPKTDFLFGAHYCIYHGWIPSPREPYAHSLSGFNTYSFQNDFTATNRRLFDVAEIPLRDMNSNSYTGKFLSASELFQNIISFGIHQPEEIFALAVLLLLAALISDGTSSSDTATKKDSCPRHSKTTELSGSSQNASCIATRVANPVSVPNSLTISPPNNAECNTLKRNLPVSDAHRCINTDSNLSVSKHYPSETPPFDPIFNNIFHDPIHAPISHSSHSIFPNNSTQHSGTKSPKENCRSDSLHNDTSPCLSSSASPEAEKNSLPLEQLCSEYLTHRALRPKTILFYEKIIKRYVAPHFAEFSSLKDLTVFKAATIILKPIVDAGKLSTAHNTRNTLVAIINHARLVHDLSNYPHLSLFNALSQVAKIPSKSEYEKSYPAMIDGDIGTNIRRIFQLFHERVKNITILALLELSFHFCLRQNEMLSIRIGNIHFEEHRIHIAETKTITARNGGFDIPLNQHTEKLLKVLIMHSKEARRKLRNHDEIPKTSASQKLPDKSVADRCRKCTDNSHSDMETDPPAQKQPGKSDSRKSCRDNSSEIANETNKGCQPEIDNHDKIADGNTDEMYLFCSARSSGKIPLSPNVLGIYLNRIPELRHKQTAHGIRAVFRTWAHRNKINDTASECVLSHKCWSKVAVSYNRDLATYLYTDRQELMKVWSDFIVSSIDSYTFLNTVYLPDKIDDETC